MNLTQAFRSYRAYRNTVAELNRLSPRELADLGIAPADIRTIAHQTAR